MTHSRRLEAALRILPRNRITMNNIRRRTIRRNSTPRVIQLRSAPHNIPSVVCDLLASAQWEWGGGVVEVVGYVGCGILEDLV